MSSCLWLNRNSHCCCIPAENVFGIPDISCHRPTPAIGMNDALKLHTAANNCLKCSPSRVRHDFVHIRAHCAWTDQKQGFPLSPHLTKTKRGHGTYRNPWKVVELDRIELTASWMPFKRPFNWVVGMAAPFKAQMPCSDREEVLNWI